MRILSHHLFVHRLEFQNLLWAPMNRVKLGLYTLELFDSAINEVTASREWQVIAK